MFHATWPNEPLTVLIDYFGKEITDGLAVCRKFKSLASSEKLSLRLILTVEDTLKVWM